jgi:midasin
VNRFTVVYADVLKSDDLMLICAQNFPEISTVTIEKLVCFVMALEHEVTYQRHFGSHGGPWSSTSEMCSGGYSYSSRMIR